MTNPGWDEEDTPMDYAYELHYAVRNYLAHLNAYTRGSEYDRPLMEHWRERLETLMLNEETDV